MSYLMRISTSKVGACCDCFRICEGEYRRPDRGRPDVLELRAAGAAKVYSETASGARTNRAELAKVLARLAAG